MSFENMVNPSRRASGVEILEDFFNGIVPEEVTPTAPFFVDGAIASRATYESITTHQVAVRDGSLGGVWYVTSNSPSLDNYAVTDAMILHPSGNWEIIFNG